MDLNNNSQSSVDHSRNDYIDGITKDTVEAELAKLKLIEEDYQSDDDNNGRVSIPYQNLGVFYLKYTPVLLTRIKCD